MLRSCLSFYCNHRYLPSFPTRRSSDFMGGLRLGWGATKTLVREDVAAMLKECPAVAAAAPGTQTSAQVVFENDNWGTRIRSEEHTSELQSLRHLVCRLLLEKKKNKRTT